ncbi:hypothetical protein FG476_06390 [Xylella fastidiosa subsp. multiplex]|uniref:Uncharacterized protein n=1 Tax=Xylella fastidiosa subsp. multiplex TaxID=644357 RepID=A0A9Q4MI40_XYLFS|nr:hypothetical protein [Xylella fastidiosa subsp. multiplex]TNV91017.1 hypothetical protein C5H23_01170 [Xylella fastidiosa]MRT47011.1 hypothetical protein [Xylella fastidiosa subsp. multiplex]MRT53220.1 hypothetical protein [Xylella fastidiosa subsp. multiplex]MRT97218.1 hypothetical protein [Xylella fastidiosa subsp. multiplex]
MLVVAWARRAGGVPAVLVNVGGCVSVSSCTFDDGFGGDGLMLWQWYAAGAVCCTVGADRG